MAEEKTKNSWYKTPKAPLDPLKETAFEYERINYPPELGPGTRHPYYMSFFINLPTLSKYTTENAKGLAPEGTEAQSEIQRHQNKSGASFVSKEFTVLGVKLPGFGRKTTRTGTVIRLYIPETLSWSFSQSWKSLGLADLPLVAQAQGAGSAGTSIADALKAGPGQGLATLVGPGGKNLVSGILPFVEGAAGDVLGDRDLFTSAFGVTVNPQIDVIYSAPELRTFSFEFFFAPRTAEEAETVQKIIYLFKFHQAPEILDDKTGFGRYFVPPSEFDLDFSVDSLGKISTCVLEDLTVDYAPNGTAFYADNAPVFTRLTLRFRELEFITKGLVTEGY